ncbi:BON domain-containing protein [Tsuneonella sp. HG249]
MEDRNRRDPRNRSMYSQRDREPYRDSEPDGSRQVEQFDDGGSWQQDRSWSQDARYSQQGGSGAFEQDHRSAVRDWRDTSPRGRNDQFGWAGGYAAREAGFGDDYYDNGLGAYEAPRHPTSRAGRSSSPGRAVGGSKRNGSDERGLLERAGDEVASWFGDVDAARRREQDHRGKGPANYKRTDERVLEDVCDCLTEDRQIDARNIQVTVNEGEVTLDGTVTDRGAKRRAEDIVESISGVGHVQNNLRVQTKTASTDRSEI